VDLSETLYKKFLTWRSRKRTESEAVTGIKLSEISSKLTFIARALSGEPIEILPALREGGWKDNRFYLPPFMNQYDELELNFKYYIFRIFYLNGQKELNLNWHSKNEKNLQESRDQAKENSSKILQTVGEEFQHFTKLHELLAEDLDDDTWLYGKWMKPDQMHGTDNLENIGQSANHGNERIETELEAKGVEEMITLQVDKKAQEDFTLTHNFEKIETIEEFNDIWRDFDGDDSLENDMDALDSLDLKHTVRVDDTVHSVYKADFGGQLTVAESKSLKEKGFYYSYPEWDMRNKTYKPDFCKVYPLLFKSTKSQYSIDCIQDNKRSIEQLKRTFSFIFNATSKVRKVESGDEFDLDVLTDMYVDIHSQVSPEERIYISKRRRKKDMSLLFLMDLSLSGDSYVNNQRVIDIEKQAVLSLGEVFSEFEVEFQVDGFFSKTRNFCSYITMKHFRDRWQNGRVNVGAIAPQGFTRIGPAIRHAGHLLSKRNSKKKWVILMSDGKPNDYDRYEGRYGVADIKRSIKELNKKEIECYAIAIEESAKYYLPQMFGVNHYNIHSDPNELPISIIKLYNRIAQSR
jgi:nitric oxide reductase NorD protein